MRQIDPSDRLVIAADATALTVFAVAGVVAARDGIDSGAFLIGIPPLVIAVLASVAVGAARRWRLRWPLLLAIVICGVGLLGAMVSFITPLLAVMAPVCGLLIAACVMQLDSEASARIVG